MCSYLFKWVIILSSHRNTCFCLVMSHCTRLYYYWFAQFMCCAFDFSFSAYVFLVVKMAAVSWQNQAYLVAYLSSLVYFITYCLPLLPSCFKLFSFDVWFTCFHVKCCTFPNFLSICLLTPFHCDSGPSSIISCSLCSSFIISWERCYWPWRSRLICLMSLKRSLTI